MSENVQFKKGDKVVSTWGLENRVMEVALKTKFKNKVLYLTLIVDGNERDCLAQWWRHASKAEIKVGHRLANPKN